MAGVGTGSGELSKYRKRIERLPDEVSARELAVPAVLAIFFALLFSLLTKITFGTLLPGESSSSAYALVAGFVGFLSALLYCRNLWAAEFSDLTARVRQNLGQGGMLQHVAESHESRMAVRSRQSIWNTPINLWNKPISLLIKPINLHVPQGNGVVAQLNFIEFNYLELCQKLGLETGALLDSRFINALRWLPFALLLFMSLGPIKMDDGLRLAGNVLLACMTLVFAGRPIFRQLMLPAALKQALYDELGGSGQK